MSSRYAELVVQTQEELFSFLRERNSRKSETLERLEKENAKLSKALHEYMKTENYNVATFGEPETYNQKTEKPKRRGRKPMVLSEINQESVEIKIKKEKISDVHSTTATTLSSASSTSNSSIKENVPIKTEVEDMPAPSWIPPKKKLKEVKTERPSRAVRTTRTKGRKKDSDVVMQTPDISTVDVFDDTEDEEDQENKTQEKEVITRSTRTKTRQTKETAEKAREISRATRKVKGEESVSEAESETTTTRSTRTKTRTCQEEPPELPVRSTRTKTIKKPIEKQEESTQKAEAVQSDQQEPPELPVRSTRTKTIKKPIEKQEQSAQKAEPQEEQVEELKDEHSDAESTKSTKTKSKKAEKKDDPSSETADKKPSEKDTKSKRNRSDSTDEEVQKNQGNSKKKTKSNSPGKDKDSLDCTGKTEYEDARSTMGLQAKPAAVQLNETYVADGLPTTQLEVNLDGTRVIETVKKNENLNGTVVLDKPQVLKKKEPSFSNDESVEIKTPPKKQIKSKVAKEVFSPYEKSSTKKKVEAFEKLQHTSTASVSKTIKDPGSAIRQQKSKYVTPLGSKIFNPTTSSTSKISRLISHSNTTTTPNESLSQLRTTQKELREKQKKLQEREQAKLKKEAMLQAAADAKRKLNEEKQLKAQQQRKALEVEKQKHIELQKQKEERQKQREQEREEYHQQQKLDLEKKRLAAKKKAQELQIQKQQQYEEQTKQPAVYMITKEPRLPTQDCYDSDDPDYKKVAHPSWSDSDHAKVVQYAQLMAGDKIKNSLFCRHAQTPDLVEIFQVIDPKKLKRNSSVLWRQPPRYTMVPDLNSTRFSDLEDDED